MGNKPSTLSKGSRVLAQKTKNSTALPHARSTRLEAGAEDANEATDPSGDEAVARRLQSLGQVQYKQVGDTYKPASEDKFTMTLQARQKIEDESAADLEKGGLRKLVPASAISSILASLKDGDSVDRVNKAFSLDPSVLPKLQRLSLPQTVQQQDVANQLLDENSPQNASTRQPVRRKRNPK